MIAHPSPHRLPAPLRLPGPRARALLPAARPAFLAATQPVLAYPFDALRQRYARAVVAGLLPRSLLASGRLERLLDALESLMLGALARRR